MATGFSIPVQTNASGGMATSSGDEQDTNVLMLALASTDNDNAFQQDEALGEAMIFDINDPGARAPVLARLRKVFQRFERLKRFKLKEDTIRWIENEDDGELILIFKYVALESDKIQDFSKTYTSASYGSNAGALGSTP
jgi:hypothetical protein